MRSRTKNENMNYGICRRIKKMTEKHSYVRTKRTSYLVENHI